MNVCTFTGRLGADAKLYRDSAGNPERLAFQIANEVRCGDGKLTQWIDCVLWGQRGGKLVEHLKKGTQVVTSGELTLRTFTRDDGTNGARLNLHVDSVDFTGGNGGER
jgi:single-strand DNA-binding protein